MNDLMNPFAQPKATQAFALGHLVKSKSQKLLITARLSLKKTAYFVRVSSALCAIMNVYVANISA